MKFVSNTRTLATKFAALVALGSMNVAAFAQAAGGSGIDAALDAVDLSSIATKVGAAGLLIVGIALVFKGPALAKRIISKV